MGVSTLHASNIKGFVFEFACARPVWIGPQWGGGGWFWPTFGVVTHFSPDDVPRPPTHTSTHDVMRNAGIKPRTAVHCLSGFTRRLSKLLIPEERIHRHTFWRFPTEERFLLVMSWVAAQHITLALHMGCQLFAGTFSAR